MALYEFDKYESSLRHAGTAPPAPYEPFRGAAKRAFLLWGEHCTECAAPDCYSTCDLYQARPDRRCRRLQYGVFANPDFPTGYGPAAELIFKRWSILVARGNAALLAPAFARGLERAVRLLSPLTNALGRFADKLVKDIRFSYVTFALLERLNVRLQRRGRGSKPDAFVFECYNPNAHSVRMQWRIAVDRARLPRATTPDQLPPSFAVQLQIPPGHFRRDIPVSSFARIIEAGLPFEISVAPEEEGTHLVFLTLDLVEYDRAEAARAHAELGADMVPLPAPAPLTQITPAARPAAKCVVFDLDGTLWSGVLLEGDVSLRPGIREILAALDARGILLSIASKNAPEHAREKLVELGLEEYFLYPQVHWGRKSDSLKAIAKDIDIGIDTLIFIDDNPFERDEVASAVPQVEVLDDKSIARLLDHPRLKGSSSSEAKNRRHMYRQAMVRSEAAKSFGDDYIEFLRASEIYLEIRPFSAPDMERVVELAQRTNQLNFSGTKYARDKFDQVVEEPGLEKYVLECADKYGSYGIIGFCLASRSPGVLRVRELMLSCRVQGKFIEQALLDYLVTTGAPVEGVEITFKKTNRNGPAQAVLRRLGFDLDGDGPLVRTVAPGEFHVDFMEIVTAKMS